MFRSLKNAFSNRPTGDALDYVAGNTRFGLGNLQIGIAHGFKEEDPSEKGAKGNANSR